ncbi:MAG: helix-turn-helix transcriptional regulator [Clostridia bacterium]|nr:helix-turn-helix transcriptional regulator [Clostridia bacterium]
MHYPRLRDLREDNDMPQKQVAAYLGIDQRVYSNYETGRREMPSRFLAPLAELYGTSVDYILGRTDASAPYPPRAKSK